jgi:cytochrome P450
VEPHYVQENILASIDTTITTIEWALAKLLKHPQFAQKAQEELDDVVGFERVVDENTIEISSSHYHCEGNILPSSSCSPFTTT